MVWVRDTAPDTVFFGFCSKDVAYIWLGPNFDDFRKLKNEMFTF